jgi:hypothetical protein
MYLAIGNHDLWNNGNDMSKINALFCKYAKLPDGTNVGDTSYDFWLNGYHFVILGTDVYNSLTATLNMDTLNWLDSVLAENRDPERPSFVFLHQSLYNTVSGSLEGQGWNGVETPVEKMMRQILAKYPETVMFNGHSHWELNSDSCMYTPTEELPINIFNTASVSYLWTSYNVTEGERLEGSQGYYLRVYKDKILVLGRDFSTGEWVASAQFCIEYEQTEDPVDPPVSDTVGGEETEDPGVGGTEIPGAEETDTNVPESTGEVVPSDSANGTTATPDTEPAPTEKKSCAGFGGVCAIFVLALGVFSAAITVIKKK